MMVTMGFALCLRAASPQQSREVTDDAERARLTAFVWAGVKSSREQVRSGTFRATGRHDSEDKPSGRLDAATEFSCAFDGVTNKLRFDSARPIKEGVAGRKQGKSWVEKMYRGKYIRLPDRAISFFEQNHQVSILRPEVPPAPFMRPFDFRAFGLTYLSGFRDGVLFDAVIQNFSIRPCDALFRHAERPDQLDYFQDDDALHGTVSIWVDEARDFAPVKLEARYTLDG